MSTTVPAAWVAAIETYALWSLTQAHSPNTVYTRRQHLQRTARTLGISDPWAVTAVELASWFERQSTWRTETRRAYRTTLRGFYSWGLRQGLAGEHAAELLPRIKPTPPNPRPAPDSVYLPALRVADERERLMLRLAAEHGMRRQEISLVHPRRDMIEDLTGWSLVVHGKGGKDREVPLLDDVAATLRALPDGWAFPGSDHGHLSARWVGKLVNRLLPGEWTMHKLRHRAATKWWEASERDLFVVQELLGHASPNTTRLYVPTDRSRLRMTVQAAAA